METAARMEGFFLSRVYLIKTTSQKEPKRQLIEFRKFPVNEIDTKEESIQILPNQRSPWYQQLTQAFYIK